MTWKRNLMSTVWHIYPATTSGQVNSMCRQTWLHYMHYEHRNPPQEERCSFCEAAGKKL